MSSEGSVSTNASSRIRQFGLYRTIDARTEEFLRLSRKRQIKQGCACAAISTAITVTVVIVILLIYEYAIAVESSLVQIKKRGNRKTSSVNITDDSPVADRLDRSYLGFDQDYYERMPLLVNAMQENSYIDPTLDATLENKEPKFKTPKPNFSKINFTPSQLRRTSPRPFIFEFKSPTPVPFSKTYGSKSWVESYRNAQRLQNIQQVIKYLEKTINAKIGDMYTVPTSKHIAFTGVYVEPHEKSQASGSENANLELLSDDSKRVDVFQSNHKSDPLFKYKPDSPGEVNLLADGFLRFSPTFVGRNDYSKVPMFKPIPNKKRHCNGRNCQNVANGIPDTQPSSSESRAPDSSSFRKAKTFSVMLNLFPLKNSFQHSESNADTEKKAPIDKIYLTTSKPLVLFKKKSTPATKRLNIIKRPRMLKESRHFTRNIDRDLSSHEKISDSSTGSNMIVQINLYTPEKKDEFTTQINNNITDLFSRTTEETHFIPISPYSTETPINLSTSQVEDFHIGSSGIIPFEARTLPVSTPPPPTYPQVTTTIPFYDVTLSSTEGVWYTKPPDILKFSHEDAKIPEEYMRYRELDYPENLYPITNRRNFRSHLDVDDIENQTLIFKLENDIKSTTLHSILEETSEDEIDTTTTTSTTTQINGHYRSNYRNPKVNSLLDPNSEVNRKRRLNLLAKGFRRPEFSLSYTEIKRNKSQSVHDNEE